MYCVTGKCVHLCVDSKGYVVHVHRPGRQSSRAEGEAVVYEPVQSAEHVVVHLAEDVVRGAVIRGCE